MSLKMGQNQFSLRHNNCNCIKHIYITRTFKNLLIALLVTVISLASLAESTSISISQHTSEFIKDSSLSIGGGGGHLPAKKAHFADQETARDVQRVAVGREVRFKCVVNDIGHHMLSWFHRDQRLLLAHGNRTINWRDRIQVSSQSDKIFFLTLDKVQLSDKVS